MSRGFTVHLHFGLGDPWASLFCHVEERVLWWKPSLEVSPSKVFPRRKATFLTVPCRVIGPIKKLWPLQILYFFKSFRWVYFLHLFLQENPNQSTALKTCFKSWELQVQNQSLEWVLSVLWCLGWFEPWRCSNECSALPSGERTFQSNSQWCITGIYREITFLSTFAEVVILAVEEALPDLLSKAAFPHCINL